MVILYWVIGVVVFAGIIYHSITLPPVPGLTGPREKSTDPLGVVCDVEFSDESKRILMDAAKRMEVAGNKIEKESLSCEICALVVLRKTLCIFCRLNNPIRNLCKDIGIDEFEILRKEGHYTDTIWKQWEGDMRYRLKDSFCAPVFDPEKWATFKGSDDRTKYVWCKTKSSGIILPLRYIDKKWRDVGYQRTNENEYDVTHWRLISEL